MTGVSGGGFHVYSGSAAAGTGKISADGNAGSIGPVGANDAVAAPIYIGDSPIADAPLAGLLGEVIVVPYDLAPEDDMHKRIVGYLAAKWGVQERLASAHPYRYTAPVTGRTPVAAQLVNRGPAMIPRGPSGSWYEANIFDPRPMVDPFDATKLMMYTTGQEAPVGSGTASIGLWRASKADFVAWTINKSLPNPWTFDRIVLQKAAAGQWDGKAGGVRLGSVVYRGGVFYLYYASQLDLTEIGLATSPDGVTFTRLASNPILSPAAQDRVDGTDVGDPFVIYDDGLLVSHRERCPAGLPLCDLHGRQGLGEERRWRHTEPASPQSTDRVAPGPSSWRVLLYGLRDGRQPGRQDAVPQLPRRGGAVARSVHDQEAAGSRAWCRSSDHGHASRRDAFPSRARRSGLSLLAGCGRSRAAVLQQPLGPLRDAGRERAVMTRWQRRSTTDHEVTGLVSTQRCTSREVCVCSSATVSTTSVR